MTKDDRVELAAIREKLIEATDDITQILKKYAPKKPQESCGTRLASLGWFCKRVAGHEGPCAAEWVGHD